MYVMWPRAKYVLPRLCKLSIQIAYVRPLSSTASTWLTHIPIERSLPARDIPFSFIDQNLKTVKLQMVADTSSSSSSSSSDSGSSSSSSSSDSGSSSSSSSSDSGSSSSSSSSDSGSTSSSSSSDSGTSSSSGSDSEAEEKLRFSVLDAALPFVHSFGWSSDAISKGAESLGYSGMIHGMFASGGVELVNHFYSVCNSKLEEELKNQVAEIKNQPNVKIGKTAFIRNAVEKRLRMNMEYIDQWPQAIALHASPTNAPNALRNIGTILDHIWYYAGDRSHDDTWNFLDRRLSDIHTVAKYFREANVIGKDIGNLAQAGILTALNILGMNIKSR